MYVHISLLTFNRNTDLVYIIMNININWWHNNCCTKQIWCTTSHYPGSLGFLEMFKFNQTSMPDADLSYNVQSKLRSLQKTSQQRVKKKASLTSGCQLNICRKFHNERVTDLWSCGTAVTYSPAFCHKIHNTSKWNFFLQPSEICLRNIICCSWMPF